VSGYGYADTCVNAGFTTVNVLPNQVLIEPGQNQWTFYTGQSINLTWTWPSTLLDNTERVTFSVYTPILRSILGTTGGGGGTAVYENVTFGARTGTISTSTFTPVATLGGPSPVQFSTVASNSVNAQSEVRVKNTTQLISVLQSRIEFVEARWKDALLSTSVVVPFDDQIFNVRWTSVGMARLGTATVSIQRCGNGGTTCSQSNPTTNSQIGNSAPLVLNPLTTSVNEVNLTFPRASTGVNVNNFYQLLVSVSVGGGATTYNFGSVGFTMGAPPSPSTSPTKSPTPSGTPTVTPTATSSSTGTPTPTSTPSPTKSPIDLLTILLKEQAEKQKAEAEATKAATSGIVGGVVGGVIFVALLGFVIFKVIQRRQSAERRQRKLAASRRATQDRESVYGVTIATVDKPSDKDIVNLAAYKAAAKAQNNPMTKASSLTASAAKSNSLTAPAAKAVGRGSGRNINRV
jgi:hypothetical protein